MTRNRTRRDLKDLPMDCFLVPTEKKKKKQKPSNYTVKKSHTHLTRLSKLFILSVRAKWTLYNFRSVFLDTFGRNTLGSILIFFLCSFCCWFFILFWLAGVFIFLRQNLTIQSRLYWNSQSSCFRFPSVGIRSTYSPFLASLHLSIMVFQLLIYNLNPIALSPRTK